MILAHHKESKSTWGHLPPGGAGEGEARPGSPPTCVMRAWR
jgi:hypothetical protein